MMLARIGALGALVIVLSAACGSGNGGPLPTADAGSGGAHQTVSCDLGTVYPSQQVIDPDNPVYQDASVTQAEVTEMFAQAKAEDTSAYRAYRAARDFVEYMECPFCACGCAAGSGHLSAIDCFKDTHGFT
jgi:hypothetical protein